MAKSTAAIPKKERYPKQEAEFVLVEIELLLKAAHLSAGAAREANELDEARGFGAAAEAVMAKAIEEAEKLRTAVYAVTEGSQ